MNRKQLGKSLFILVPLLMIISFAFAQKISKKSVDYVNTIIGASTEQIDSYHGLGKTFPGVMLPSGMVQLSPDTKTGGDNGSGYSFHHQTIEGFSFTHLSGVGAYGDLGNFLVMPTTGPLKINKGQESIPGDGYRSRFSHDNEITQAGYYAVTLDDYSIRTELTATERTGIIRFTFPESKQSRIQIDLARRIGGTSTRQYLKVINDHSIQGWIYCNSEGGGFLSGTPKGLVYKVFFYAEFSKSLNYGFWSAEIPDGTSRKREDVQSKEYQDMIKNSRIYTNKTELEGKNIGFYTTFETKANDQVLMKTGISFVSMEGAKMNLETELPHWNFDMVRSDAQKVWNDALSVVEVEGGSEKQKNVFYTMLYHTLLDPRKFADVDGAYYGADHKTHQSKDFVYRTIFSRWDVFRSEMPLLTLIDPERMNDEINSLIEIAAITGNGLPKWELLSTETGCMVGDPAISVITDGYRKGIRKYDVNKAYAICRQTALGPVSTRNDAEYYNRLGFAPNSVSITLENCYADWCMYRLAKELGKKDDEKLFYDKSFNYRNIFCDSVKMMRAKNKDGLWTKWMGPLVSGQGCVESNPMQQGWFVPHDIQGLINLTGKGTFAIRLNDFFEKAPSDFSWSNYYNHPNEPVHHVAYLFNYLGTPWLTQKWVRKILENGYSDDVKGIRGNEDVGQMSAWYVLSAMGFHPVAPGDNIYLIGSPLFQKMTIKLNPKYFKGKTFRVVALNNKLENVYVQSAILNGKPLNRSWLLADEVTNGGELFLEMGALPNKNWGSDQSNLPPSMSNIDNFKINKVKELK